MSSKELLEINNFLLAEIHFYNCFLDQGNVCAYHDICGLAQSMVVVKEKIIKRTTWQWQE